jgi:hypothetical protein
MPKTGGRLVIATTASDPAHWVAVCHLEAGGTVVLA